MRNTTKRFYHVYTKGLERDIIFRERADYVTGMNYVPVSLTGLDLKLLAFVLMSNHSHFVFYGSKEEIMRFINMYKRLVSRYISNKYGDRKLLRAIETGCTEIDLNNEGLKRITAYVLNNPVKAGVNCLPQNYEWGSGACYFSNIDVYAETVPLSYMSVREQIRLLRSETKVNQNYRVCSSGYVLPASYVDVQFIENLFRRAGSFEYFLSKTVRTYTEREGVMTYSDTLVMNALSELLEKKYEALGVDELSMDVRRKLVIELRKQFNSPPKQLARVLKCSLSEVVNLLNS